MQIRLIGGITAAMAAAGSLLIVASSCSGGPTVTLGAHVPIAVRVPVDEVNHSGWDGLLRKYVDAAGMVDYAAWKASASDRHALSGYLRQLSSAAIPVDADRHAVLAFWINAYNAVTIEGILREYPTSSIRNHTAKLVGYNIWKDLHLVVEGKKYSLNQIEHEVLRPLGEPRIHFAIVCASIGCPRLLNEAYTAQKLDQQLDANTKAFFADQSKFRYAANGTFAVSPILKWFAEDFGSTQSEQLRNIAPWLPDAQARQLALHGNVRVTYLDYDWGLNDQQRGRRAARR